MAASKKSTDAEVIFFRDTAKFEDWLERHVDLHEGVWLKLAKKSSGIQSLTDDEAVDAGLCFGWISGQRRGYDEKYYLQKYVPRRPKSRWSQVNVAKVEELLPRRGAFRSRSAYRSMMQRRAGVLARYRRASCPAATPAPRQERKPLPHLSVASAVEVGLSSACPRPEGNDARGPSVRASF